MTPIRRRIAAAALALAVVPALAACGDESGTDDTTAESTSTPTETSSESAGASGDAPAEEPAFPVTIEHKYGSTEITEEPKRVVVIGLSDQDALLALGVVPVGVTYWYGDKELGGINPWAEEAIGDAERPVLLDPTDGAPIEEIVKLEPDLIIGQYAGITEDEYDTLAKFAPTVVQPGDYSDYGVPWEEATVTLGKAVGKEQEAVDLVEEVTGVIADAAAAHPEFAGKSAITVTPYEGLFVYGPEDPRAQILAGLGFVFPESLAGDEEQFGSSLSAERASDLDDVDVTVWLGLTKEKDVESVYESTSAYREGRYVDIDDTVTENYAVAHSFVTVLSIPYVLESFVPQLAAAVDGDPATTVPAPVE